jgi:hypothetical protein
MGGVRAQDSPDTFLVLDSDSTALQTGGEYEVRILVENVSAVWLGSIEITYDPAQLYILGTQAGSPVTSGAFWGVENTGALLNVVQGETVIFAQSMFNPAEPRSGSGVIGSFRIVPLTAGAAELRFGSGTSLTRTIFDTSSGQRVATASEAIPFTPVLLQLTVTGETVEPPSEATATPTPTPSPTPDDGTAQVAAPTEAATLVNITRAPATPETTVGVLPQANPDNTALLIALAAVLIGVMGLGVLFFLYRRRG